MKNRKTAKTDSNSSFTNKLSRNRRSDPNKYSDSDVTSFIYVVKKLKNTFLTILIIIIIFFLPLENMLCCLNYILLYCPHQRYT